MLMLGLGREGGERESERGWCRRRRKSDGGREGRMGTLKRDGGGGWGRGEGRGGGGGLKRRRACGRITGGGNPI